MITPLRVSPQYSTVEVFPKTQLRSCRRYPCGHLHSTIEAAVLHRLPHRIHTENTIEPRCVLSFPAAGWCVFQHPNPDPRTWERLYSHLLHRDRYEADSQHEDEVPGQMGTRMDPKRKRKVAVDG